MMEMNPGLFSGLITAWPRARVLWFWVEGAAPRNLNMGPMSWISSGPVPLCSTDAVQSSGVSHDGPILNLKFTDIRWDQSTESLIQFDRIEAELGHPFEQDGAGRPTLNLLYWSEVLVWQCSLVYDLPQKAFRQRAQGSSRLLSSAEVIQLVTRVLQGMAATVPGFPLPEINLRRIRQLLGLMQVRAAVEPVAEKAVVDRFLTETVQPCPGGRLLSEELRGAFATVLSSQGTATLLGGSFLQGRVEETRAFLPLLWGEQWQTRPGGLEAQLGRGAFGPGERLCMTRERIEELALLLLPDRKARIDGIPAEVDAVARAVNDPGYGWKVIKSFADSGQALPAFVTEPALVRAYGYLRNSNDDDDVRQALVVEHSESKVRRIMLRCLLLRPEYGYAAIAERIGITEAAVLIYENLFWNLRDRMDDPIYIASLVYPQGRQVEFDPDYSRNEDPMYLALRATMNDGIEAAEELLGLRAPAAQSNTERQGQALAARIMGMASFAARMGFLHQDLPIFRHAFRIMKVLRTSRRMEAAAPVPEINLSVRLNQAFAAGIARPSPGPNRISRRASGQKDAHGNCWAARGGCREPEARRLMRNCVRSCVDAGRRNNRQETRPARPDRPAGPRVSPRSHLQAAYPNGTDKTV